MNKDLRIKEYRSPGGFKVLVGQNDWSNDQLTFKIAGQRDLWFHINGFPGSHVLLVVDQEGTRPAKEDVRFAAQIAAYHSRMKDGGKVTVNYCPVSQVKKPRKAKPGQVIIKGFRTVKVRAQLPQEIQESAESDHD